ncbi:MAG TPA: MltA domain-containing protein, partial [Chakrabartia sp.]|nr:MltA domain-containing protein [Chakrabartia sp.]
MRIRPVLPLIGAALLSACSSGIVPPSATTPPREKAPKPAISSDPVIKPVASTPVAAAPAIAAAGSASAIAAGVMAAPVRVSDDLAAGRAAKALAAFRVSCPSLIKRTDSSGLTLPTDWQAACTAAKSWPDADATRFFADQFEPVQVADGKAFATGYYEPEISGSRTQSDAYAVPVYRRPPELVEIDLGQFSDTLKGKKIRGQVKGNSFVPYADRTAIEQGALAGRGLEIAWAADAAEFFFLQVQGSGRLRLPDGSVMRIGYDGQNGKDYTGIGKLMRERGLLAPGEATMQGIINWIRTHPAEGTAIMRENKSWVFFKEL